MISKSKFPKFDICLMLKCRMWFWNYLSIGLIPLLNMEATWIEQWAHRILYGRLILQTWILSLSLSLPTYFKSRAKVRKEKERRWWYGRGWWVSLIHDVQNLVVLDMIFQVIANFFHCLLNNNNNNRHRFEDSFS